MFRQIMTWNLILLYINTSTGFLSKLRLPGSPQRRNPNLWASEPRHSDCGRGRSRHCHHSSRKTYSLSDTPPTGGQGENRTDSLHTTADSTSAAGRLPSTVVKTIWALMQRWNNDCKVCRSALPNPGPQAHLPCVFSCSNPPDSNDELNIKRLQKPDNGQKDSILSVAFN